MVQRKREKHETKMSYPVDQSFYAAKMKHRDQKKIKNRVIYGYVVFFELSLIKQHKYCIS